ncbi:MAG TPA: MBL fold metallo-hydrolase [Anaerohalosphaeraceae bacterium]|nr:MBL fold metallo-hydrolase [Anaerohalosphaeraceae bacterium]
MPSHNLAHIQIGNLDVLGYSVAGEETIVAMPQLDVCFDIGKAPDQVIPINHVLLTHGHMDHAVGIAYYLSHRQFCGLSPGTVLAPPNTLGPIRQILNAWSKLDGSRIKSNLVPVGPGEEYPVKPNLFVRVFPTKHTVGAVGFSVLERRKKLREEYQGLTGPQLVELKRQGIEIDRPLEIPLVSYLGDTQYVDFSQLDYISNSRLLIAECTFYEEEHAGRAEAGRHMHIEELGPLLEKMNNEFVLLTHLTQRTSLSEARQMLKQKLPSSVFRKVFLLMDYLPTRRAGKKTKKSGSPEGTQEETAC